MSDDILDAVGLWLEMVRDLPCLLPPTTTKIDMDRIAAKLYETFQMKRVDFLPIHLANVDLAYPTYPEPDDLANADPFALGGWR